MSSCSSHRGRRYGLYPALDLFVSSDLIEQGARGDGRCSQYERYAVSIVSWAGHVNVVPPLPERITWAALAQVTARESENSFKSIASREWRCGWYVSCTGLPRAVGMYEGMRGRSSWFVTLHIPRRCCGRSTDQGITCPRDRPWSGSSDPTSSRTSGR